MSVAAVVRAQFVVASLGESASPPWWRSQATSVVGQRMLARLFPRTAVGASLETASRAARIEHDAHLGRIGAYHLFRLPTTDEVTILEFLRSGASSDLTHELAGMSEAADRLGALEALAAGKSTGGTQGPVHCGTVDRWRRGEALAQMCAAYLAGFRSGTPTYPYLKDATS